MDASRGVRGGPVRSERSRSSTGGDLPFFDDINADELDAEMRRSLRSLDRKNADEVTKHLVMAGRLVDEDPELALRHARAARSKASRIGLVREAMAIIAYRSGEWAEALAEFRAARRILGGQELLPLIADCERGVGRPEKALEIARSEESQALVGAVAEEFTVVIAGACSDMGDFEQARKLLEQEDLSPQRQGYQASRLFYVYAEVLLALGHKSEAMTWFLNAAAADIDDVTDAEDRLGEFNDETF